MPHASGSMPAALAAGLASLDEQAVAALGFVRVAILRPAAPPGAATSSGLQRVADIVLAQLRIMVPQTLQPVRAHMLLDVTPPLASRAAETGIDASVKNTSSL